MFTLCQYFGWRASTTASVQLEDLTAVPGEISFGTKAFKGRRDVYPVGKLRLPSMPLVLAAVAQWILRRIREEGGKSGKLFPN